MLSSRNFMVSCLIFRSLSHFEFISVYGVRERSNLIDLHVAVQLSQYHLMKRPFPIVYSCLLCQRLVDCRCVGLFLGSLFCFIDPHQLSFEYHTVLIGVALSHCLRVMPHALFFFFRIALAILGLLWFYIDFRIIWSSSVQG